MPHDREQTREADDATLPFDAARGGIAVSDTAATAAIVGGDSTLDDSPVGGVSPTAETQIDNRSETPGGTRAGKPPEAADQPSSASRLPDIPGYDVLGLLGRGGMGAVYKARHRELKRLVALKVILAGPHAGPTELARFRQEAEAVARLQHPHIVQIFEVGTHVGQPFFSLEYVAGGSLANKLGGAPLPPREAAALVETLARAIQAAHERGVIHRDLKPANILLADDGSPKIADFGLAEKQLEGDSSQTRTGEIMGTPSYMAPEQAAGEPKSIGPATDVYALGAILYEGLTGRPPFRAATAVETVMQVRTQEPISPCRLLPRLPRDLETICLKCLHKDPRKRYGSSLELAEDLHRFLNGQPILARPVGRVERAARWCRRNPLAAGLIGTVAAALVAVAATMTYAYVHVSDALDQEALQRERAENKEALASAFAASEHELRIKSEKLAISEGQARKAAEAAGNEAKKARGVAEVALDRSDVHLAASRLRLADQSWQANDVPTASQLLNRCPPDLRSWEWHYLKRLCNSELLMLRGHESKTTSAQYSRDGEWIVSAGGDGTARIWDAESGEQVHEFRFSPPNVLQATLSPDKERLAVLLADETIRIVNVESKSEEKKLAGVVSRLWNRLLFSPDGKLLAATKGDVFDVESGERKLGPFPNMIDVAFGPEAKWVVTLGDRQAHFWDPDGALLRTFPAEGINLAVSPDGKLLAVTKHNGIDLLDAETGASRFAARGAYDSFNDVAFSPNNAFVAASSSDRAVRVWDVAMQELVATYRGHANRVATVAYNHDGTRLVSVDDEGARIWDATQDPAMRKWQTGGTGIAFSPDGKRFVTVSGVSGLVVRDTASGQAILSQPAAGSIRCAAFSPGGDLIATGADDNSLVLWNSETGERVKALSGHGKPVNFVAFGGNGAWLVSVADDNTAGLWELPSGELLSGQNLPQKVFRVRVRPGSTEVGLLIAGRVLMWNTTDPANSRVLPMQRVHDFDIDPFGKIVATAHFYDRGIQLWDIESGELTQSLPARHRMGRVTFGVEGTRVAAATLASEALSEVLVWDAATGQELLSFRETGQIRLLSELTFTSDGRYLAAQGSTFTRLWDADRQQRPFVLAGHGDMVLSAAFAPGGARLASASADRTVRVWDARRGHELLTLRGHGHFVKSVAYSQDGKLLATAGGADKTLRLWDAADGTMLKVVETEAAAIHQAAFSRAGDLLAAAGSDGMVRLFSVPGLELVTQLEGHTVGVNTVAFSQDGALLASGAGKEGSPGELKLWNVASGVCLNTSTDHAADVAQVAFDRQGKHLASCDLAGAVKLWDAHTLTFVYEFSGGDKLTALAWSPDGKYLAAGGFDHKLHLWDVPKRAIVAATFLGTPVRGLAFDDDGEWLAVATQEQALQLWPLMALRERE